ncbi:hypothetical protein NA56DRAFT_711876 [Hyaloscypha hepaticicola]|uniref:Uncharacterized protein n=1 Tax=Hyaloscypha hepaticicola TaxID=2082293 RepID=A0A2J6PI11_9HELO|nr:hypothetical protein NA56DRAFT_711876 [Hyaloscypha hepaticicola]
MAAAVENRRITPRPVQYLPGSFLLLLPPALQREGRWYTLLRTARRRHDDYVRYIRFTHDGDDKMYMLHREVKIMYSSVSRGLAIEGHGMPSF